MSLRFSPRDWMQAVGGDGGGPPAASAQGGVGYAGIAYTRAMLQAALA